MRINVEKQLKIGELLTKLIMLVILAGILFPFFWLTISSFKFNKDIIHYPPTLFSAHYTLSHYVNVWNSIPLLRFFINTIVFAGGTTLVSVLFDSMTGYAFARLDFPGKKILFTVVLLTMMMPFQVLMIPLFVELFKMNILNTYLGLILPRATSAFGIYMMRSFFVSLPKAIEEAGRIDGCSEFKIYRSLMLPLCKPAFVTLGIIHFMNNWNDLLYPLMLTSSTEMRTLSAGLAMLVGDKVIEYGPTLAASLLSILPLVLAYLFAQKYFVQGIASTGLKN